MFGLGLVRCEMAKEGTLSSQRVISHNDGLTGSTLLRSSSHPLKGVCVCAPPLLCEYLAVCLLLYLTLGTSVCDDVARCLGEDTPPGVAIGWLNSYLRGAHEHNCASVCKKGPFAVGKWNGYLIGEKIPVREQAYAFVCVSGEQVVSHRDIWCAPR